MVALHQAAGRGSARTRPAAEGVEIVSNTEDVPDAWGIIANHRNGDNAIPPGAQCWLFISNPGSGYETNQMYCRSRGSRWICKWVKADRLENWRVKWVPPGIREGIEGVFEYATYPTKEAAQAQLDSMKSGLAAAGSKL